MANDNIYIWYSGATDLTGKTLMENLDVVGGNEKPEGKDIVICWGTKTAKKTLFPNNTTVLNHPDNIRDNRNKLIALKLMKESEYNIPVASFYSPDEARAEEAPLPLVGRTKFHQGGKGFWLCLTKHHVEKAIGEGAQYFQTYIPVKDEYRLHVFDGKCIYSAKKVERDNMRTAFVEQHKEKAKNAAKRNGVNIDETTMDFILTRLVDEQQPHPDQIVKSNTRGWRFSKVKKVDKALTETAENALKALGLDFGAVDCCIDEDGKPWIIEVNTGPGLKGSSLEAWVDAFKAKLVELATPKKEVKAKPKAKVAGAIARKKPAKEKLVKTMNTLADLLEVADDDEAEAIRSAAIRMLGG